MRAGGQELGSDHDYTGGGDDDDDKYADNGEDDDDDENDDCDEEEDGREVCGSDGNTYATTDHLVCATVQDKCKYII